MSAASRMRGRSGAAAADPLAVRLPRYGVGNGLDGVIPP